MYIKNTHIGKIGLKKLEVSPDTRDAGTKCHPYNRKETARKQSLKTIDEVIYAG